MSNGSLTIPLSNSAGGAPIRLDDGAIPGKVIHANPVDSGGNDVIQHILVGNPNTGQVTLWVATVGPSSPAPTERSQMVRIDVPSTAEGVDVRLFYTPFILAPGYTYHISCVLQSGQVPPYLYGYATRHGAAPYAGYGGLKTTTQQAMADLVAGQWAVVPMQVGSVGQPVNVTQDPANNVLSVNALGVWAVTAYTTLEFTKDPSNDRILYLRLWNVTKGVEATDSPFPLYVEQGSSGGSWAIPAIPLDVISDIVGDQIQVQIGGSSLGFAGIQVDKAGFNVFKVG